MTKLTDAPRPKDVPPAGTGKRATLKTIAELTGLSLSTVSLALRGGGALKPETTDWVVDVARRVGYVPDRAGVRLRTGKTNVIALVLYNIGHSVDFTSNLITGIGRSLADTPYHLMVMPEFEDRDSIASVRYILDNHTADGVILTHTSPRDERVKLLLESGLPFVCHGRTEFARQHAFHDFHSEKFLALAVERRASLGCRRVLLAQVSTNTTNYRNILAAFDKACGETGIAGSVYEGDVQSAGFDEIRQLGQRMAKSPDRPDGVICTGELFAMALFSSLRDEGVVVGRDIKLVCKQTSDILPIVFPQSDGIEEDVLAAGVELTRLVMAAIGGAPPAELQTLGEPLPRWRCPA
jgi:LacI family transcriptional regulator